jgi:hypothetical protein
LAPPASRTVVPAIVAACHAGLDPASLRAEAFARLRRAVPSQAVWFASVDPATLLPTSSLRLGLPEETASLFRRNEDLDDDVNSSPSWPGPPRASGACTRPPRVSWAAAAATASCSSRSGWATSCGSRCGWAGPAGG